MVPGSSMVEQLTVNQLVAGSSPAPGAKKKERRALFIFLENQLNLAYSSIVKDSLLLFVSFSIASPVVIPAEAGIQYSSSIDSRLRGNDRMESRN